MNNNISLLDSDNEIYERNFLLAYKIHNTVKRKASTKRYNNAIHQIKMFHKAKEGYNTSFYIKDKKPIYNIYFQ